jgi:hypothetical protein
MPKPLPVPPDAKADPSSVKMIRAWIADGGLHCILRIGFWEGCEPGEPDAWGMLLADLVSHIADAHELEYGRGRDQTVARIQSVLAAELDNPTKSRDGNFHVRGTRRATGRPKPKATPPVTGEEPMLPGRARKLGRKR